MFGNIGQFSGGNITVSVHAVERVFNWPEKKRSRRLIKKLTKKRGPQITLRPAAYKTPWGFVMHPELYADLKRRTA